MAFDETLIAKLRGVVTRFEEVEQKLADPAVIARQTEFKKLSKEYADLRELVEKFRLEQKLAQQLAENEELLRDAEMKELAREEIDRIKGELPPLEEQIKFLLLPKDPNDERNILLEIRAGAGGEEAA